MLNFSTGHERFVSVGWWWCTSHTECLEVDENKTLDTSMNFSFNQCLDEFWWEVWLHRIMSYSRFLPTVTRYQFHYQATVGTDSPGSLLQDAVCTTIHNPQTGRQTTNSWFIRWPGIYRGDPAPKERSSHSLDMAGKLNAGVWNLHHHRGIFAFHPLYKLDG